MPEATLTAARLREVLHYDPLTGVFTWLVQPANCVKAGSIAGTIDKAERYRRIQIDGTIYRAQRLAVLYMTGEWPEDEVDHRDGQRDNNRWRNLRDATKAINMQNKRNRRGGHLLGTFFEPSRGKWGAQIGVDGKKIRLGRFNSEEAAHAAYLEAKRRLHPGCTI